MKLVLRDNELAFHGEALLLGRAMPIEVSVLNGMKIEQSG